MENIEKVGVVGAGMMGAEIALCFASSGCKLGLGHPIGPFALMDLTSNDLNLKVGEVLYDTYGERFKPRPILRQKVYANHLGRKTGRGWYEY